MNTPDQTSTEPTGLAVRPDPGGWLISAAEFQELAEMPAAIEWLANIDNPNTRRAYRRDGGIQGYAGDSRLRRAPPRTAGPRHRLAEATRAPGLGAATRCRKLSAVSSFFR